VDPRRFDRIATVFAERHTRRAALRAGAIGAGGLALAGVASGSAQDASPKASPVAVESADGVTFMFVQTFGAGSIDTATDGVQTLLLTADHLAGQTLFFSDRPERVVGMVPTADFLSGGKDAEGLGFTPSDPPNAALVLPNGNILIVELLDPEYDAASGQVRYQMRVLDDVTQVDLHLDTEPLTRDDAVGEFTAASLFIDDCPDGHVVCWNPDSEAIGTIPANSGSMGFCWNGSDLCCQPCESPPSGDDWNAGCDYVFGDQCGAGCGYSYAAGFSCSQ
jgi:hypothetical protein